MSIKSVLVLDGNQRSALAVTRSLGRHNLLVITASESEDSICKYSNYSQSHVKYPDPKYMPEEFIVWLKEFLRSHDISVVFPITDITCNVLAPYGKSIGDAYLPLAAIETIRIISDKSHLTRIADNLGIPYPKSIYISDIKEIDKFKSQLSYPCVIKPSFSRIFANNKWEDTAVTIVHSAVELDSLLERQQYLAQHPFMVQEYIKGTGQGIFSLYSHGQEVSWFAHKRLREKPPWGGVSVLSESVALPNNMVEMSRKILDSVSWHGVAMVEFKVAEDGTPYLIEINARFWGSLQLAIDAGIDFPYLLYKITVGTVGEEPGTPERYHCGKRLRWFLGDLDSLLISLKSNSIVWRDKIRLMFDFLSPDFRQTKHEIFRAGDSMPAVYELKKYVASFFAPK